MLHFCLVACTLLAVYVLRRKTHRRIVSWLAWLALAFIVMVPFVSRVMPVHAAMQGMAGMTGSDYPHAMAGNDHPATPDHPADPTDRCSYCVPLDHQSLLTAHVILHLLPAPPCTFMPVALHEAKVRKTPNQDSRPRGPPYLS